MKNSFTLIDTAGCVTIRTPDDQNIIPFGLVVGSIILIALIARIALWIRRVTRKNSKES